MKTRIPLGTLLLAVFGALTYWAYQSAPQLVNSNGYNLLFDSAWILILVAPLAGIFLGTFAHTGPTKLVDGKVERHDEKMFIQHWTHAIGCVTLLITGIGLGTMFIPRTFHSMQAVGFSLNMHFVGIIFFFFGIGYFVTQGLLTGEIKEHSMPRKGDLGIMAGHYLGMIFGTKMPPEERYLAAERVVFPGWIVGVGGIVITGFIKTAAHIWNLPPVLMEWTTLFHGIFALLMVLLLIGHVTAAALIPAGWPMIHSMITGYCSEEYARHHHEKWWEEIEREKNSGLGNSVVDRHSTASTTTSM